jgi:hypothetical protein
MKLNELISSFEIYTTNEEKDMLSKLKQPVMLKTLLEREQQIVQNMIRKGLVAKTDGIDPMVVADEY